MPRWHLHSPAEASRTTSRQPQWRFTAVLVCACAHVLGGRERGWDDGLIGTSTCSAYKSQVHSGRCKSQRMKHPPWLFPTVPRGRWVLVFLVVVHRQSRDWNCPSMYRSVRPVTGLSSGAEHQGQTRQTDFAAYSWRKITIKWPLK